MKKFRYLICGLFIFALFVPTLAQDNTPFAIPDYLQTINPDNVNKINFVALTNSDIKQVTISPDSSMIAVASQHEDDDYAVSVMNIKTNTVVSSIQGRMDFYRDLVWSPDSKAIAVISDRTTGSGVEERSVKTYTIETGSNPNYYILGKSDAWYSEDIKPMSDGTIINPVEVAWNPASNMIAVAFYGKLDIYDVNADTALISEAVAGIKSVNWSSDGKMIITRSTDNHVNVWGVSGQN